MKRPSAIRIGGAGGYSIRAVGYRFDSGLRSSTEDGSNPAKNVYHTLQLWRDHDLHRVFQCTLNCEFADVERGVTDLALQPGVAIRPDDLRFLVELARTVYARRAMDPAWAAQQEAA